MRDRHAGIAATWPQSTLPSVRAPKNTVTNIASPRARTQSGSATCAETLRLASTAIHETPASMLADERRRRMRGRRRTAPGKRGAERAGRNQPVGAEAGLQPGQHAGRRRPRRRRWRRAGSRRAAGRRRSAGAPPAAAAPSRRWRTGRRPAARINVARRCVLLRAWRRPTRMAPPKRSTGSVAAALPRPPPRPARRSRRGC